MLATPLFGAPDAAAQGRPIWEGFHFGGHVGWGDYDYGISQINPALPLVTIDDSADGLIGGIVYGSSWQRGQWVFGTDSDWTWGDAETGLNTTGSITVPGNPPTTTGPFSARVDIDHTASTRGRIGHLFQPNVMIYGTAGIAFAKVDVSGPLIAGGSDDERLVGFVIGGGLEATFENRMFARVEYLHTDYSDENFAEVGGGTFNVDLDSDVVRGAVGYRFDWSPFDLLANGG